MDRWQPKCVTCGRFFPYRQPESSWVFVPDSHVSYEEDRLQCAPCTERHGRLTPNQSVVIELCSGVIA